MERGWGEGAESFPRAPGVLVEKEGGSKAYGRERWRAWAGEGGDGGDDGHGVKPTRCKGIRFGTGGGTGS